MNKFVEKTEQLSAFLAVEIPKAEEVAIRSMLGYYIGRIFNDGKDSSGSKIGDYSTTPMLTGAKNFRTKTKAAAFFDAEDVEFRTVKSKGKNLALGLIEGGYKEFRELNGLRSDTVDLQFTGSLFESIIVGTYGANFVLGYNSSEKARIAQHLENKYGKKIFYPTEEEIKIARDTYYDYLRERVQILFNSW